jgi:hypothetical protein
MNPRTVHHFNHFTIPQNPKPDRLLAQQVHPLVRCAEHGGRLFPEDKGTKLVRFSPPAVYTNLLEYSRVGTEVAFTNLLSYVEMNFSVPPTRLPHPTLNEVLRQIPRELQELCHGFEIINLKRSTWRHGEADSMVVALYTRAIHHTDLPSRDQGRIHHPFQALEVALGNILSGPELLRRYAATDASGSSLFRENQEILTTLPCRCYGCDLLPSNLRLCTDENLASMLEAEQLGLTLRIPTSQGWRWKLRLADIDEALSLAITGPINRY